MTLENASRFDPSWSPRFWDCYAVLPSAVQKLADDKFELLKCNPRHPSLHLKQVGKFWSVQVGLRYRALGVSAPDSIIWFWIGSHKDYNLLIG